MSVGGRTSKLTPVATKIILAGIKAGLPVKMAAWKAGLGEHTVYKWNREAKKPGAAPEHIKFFNDYQKALVAAFEVRMKRIAKHGKRDWKADAWWIERMYPDLMGSEARTVRELKALLAKILKGEDTDAHP